MCPDADIDTDIGILTDSAISSDGIWERKGK